jgi:hypothetical protein
MKPETPLDSPILPLLPQKPDKRKVALFGLLGIAVIAVIVASFLFANHAEKTTDNGVSSKLAFPNQLTPASEIRVGDFPYVSPCQVLPLSDAQDIFGSLPSDGYVHENSLAVSVPKTDPTHGLNSVQTYCDYEYGAKDVNEVTLNAEQFKDATDVKDVPTMVSVSPDKAQQTIDGFKKNAGGDAEAMVNTMQSSLASYKKAVEGDTSIKADGMVLPGLTGGIQVVHGNVVYTVDMKGSDAKASDTSKTSKQLDQLAKALKVIASNAQNSHLDQSPASTILGSSDTVGTTKVFDSCAMLTTAIFKAATSLDENTILDRTTPIANFAKPTHSINGDANPPNSECLREHEDMVDIAISSTSIDLNIDYGSSASAAKQQIQSLANEPSGGKGTALQTSADEAYVIPSDGSFGDNIALYEFRVGAYVGSITFTSSSVADLSDEGTDTPAPQDQYVQAINLVVAQIHKLEQH